MKQRLTEDEVEEIFKHSKWKYEQMKEETDEIYEEGIENDRMRKVIESAVTTRENSIENRKHEVMKKRLFEDGWINQDPYFLLCLEAITPAIYQIYAKGTSSYDIKTSYRASPMNEMIADRIGEENLKEVMRKFKEYGQKYKERLPQNVVDKLNISYNGSVWRGIPKSIVMDWLAKIRSEAIDPKNLEILKTLLDLGKLSTQKLTDNVPMSYSTIRRRIQGTKLMKKYVDTAKQGQKRLYWLNDEGKEEVKNIVNEVLGDK